MTLPIETDRLRIRRFAESDIDAIQAFARHRSVAREIPNIPYENEDELAAYIEEQNGLELFATKKCVDLAIERIEDGQVLGLLSAQPRHLQRGGVALWAVARQHLRRTAVVAAQAALSAVYGESRVTPVTAGYPAAVVALQGRGEAAAVEE